MKARRALGGLLSYGLLVSWGVIASFPLLWMALSAFKPSGEVFAWPPTPFPKSPTLDNFVHVWTEVPFTRYLVNSIFMSLGQIVSVLIIGALAAYVLAILRFPGRAIIWFFVLGGLIIPEQVMYVPRFLMIVKLKWMDTYQGMMAPYLASAFGTFLLAQFFQSIPMELIDAARIDGLDDMGILFRVVLPLSRPAMSTLSIFTWLGSWNRFFWPLLVVNSEKMRPMPIGLAAFWEYEGTMSFGYVLAANTSAIIFPLIVFLAFQRYFVQGISMSGLKGAI